MRYGGVMREMNHFKLTLTSWLVSPASGGRSLPPKLPLPVVTFKMFHPRQRAVIWWRERSVLVLGIVEL